MITLKKYREQLSEFYEYLLDKLFKKELCIVDKLMLSSIGARTCYSTAPNWEELTKDPRISDENERFAFLERLYEAKHDSIFAHSPTLFVEDGRFTRFNVFKLWQFYDEKENKTYFCANARHLVEAMRYKNLSFDVLISYIRNQKKPTLNPVLQKEEDMNVAVVKLPETNPWFWISVIAFGVSRVMTHQYVRHTWLNFSQRSHRYTKVEGVVCPNSIKEDPEAKELFYKAYYEVGSAYLDLVKLRCIKKEDARFIMPNGSATTIMASAPRFVWEDFMEKRCHPKAQWEIRKFASMVKAVLNETR